MSSGTMRSAMSYIVLPLGLAAAVAALTVYLTHNGSFPTPKPNPALSAVSRSQSGNAGKFACPVSLPAAEAGEQAHALDYQAQKLMGNGQFDQALARYRELAAKDPAFPGINLDLSMAFSKLNQPQAAKQAVDAQLAISMCLAQLFPNELEPYCKAEGFASTASCVKEIGSVQQGAYIQAALVQMDVDHGSKVKSTPKQTAAVQLSELKMPKRDLAVEKEPARGRVKATSRSTPNSLASGEGTDAALGAYSK